MKKGAKVFWVVLGLMIAFILFGLVAGTRNMSEVRDYLIPEVDLASLEDGNYDGSCDIGRWAIRVTVTVKDHRITEIRIPEGQIPILPEEFIAELNASLLHTGEPDFDAVTGATISSRAYMIAVTNALSK